MRHAVTQDEVQRKYTAISGRKEGCTHRLGDSMVCNGSEKAKCVRGGPQAEDAHVKILLELGHWAGERPGERLHRLAFLRHHGEVGENKRDQ